MNDGSDIQMITWSNLRQLFESAADEVVLNQSDEDQLIRLGGILFKAVFKKDPEKDFKWPKRADDYIAAGCRADYKSFASCTDQISLPVLQSLLSVLKEKADKKASVQEIFTDRPKVMQCIQHVIAQYQPE